MVRRYFIGSAAALAIPAAAQPPARIGRLKQSATRGCFGKMDLDERCKTAVSLGLKGLDLVGEADWPTLKKYGLIATMCPGGGPTNNKETRDQVAQRIRENIGKAAAAGMPNVIVMSGNRVGMSDEQGIDNSVALLRSVKAVAEDKGVTMCLELLNSKVNHPDYHADHTRFGVEICRRVESPRMKLLYDIYHMQIMEGDVIRTIRDNIAFLGHFHTAGVPGRNEIDETQELNYRAIAKAIVDTGYAGYLAHEYQPKRDPATSLAQAIAICDV